MHSSRDSLNSNITIFKIDLNKKFSLLAFELFRKKKKLWYFEFEFFDSSRV